MFFLSMSPDKPNKTNDHCYYHVKTIYFITKTTRAYDSFKTTAYQIQMYNMKAFILILNVPFYCTK